MAIKLDPMLTKAVRLVNGKKYGEAVRLLEPEVVRYHDSFYYYYILGSSCLRAGDFGGGYTYFKRAREIKMRDAGTLLGMAACYLRRGDTERAIDLYLEVQELEPRNSIVKKALAVLRKYSGRENLSAWIDSGKTPRLFPPLIKLSFPWPRVLLGAALFLAVLVLARAILLRSGVLDRRGSERQNITGISLEWEDRDTPVQTGGSYRYILTRDQVLEAYEQGRALFTKYRDEDAKVHLNRIIESNASDSIKNKARLLISYTEVPGFDTFKKDDSFPYSRVIQEPVLYRDCYVIWQGMAANMDVREAGFSFELLVGYDTKRVLEGRVKVDFDFSETVDPERPLEVLGRIVPVSAAGGEGVRLEGVALHQAARR
jgi:tetratricopeptide (TPR) repeat protein